MDIETLISQIIEDPEAACFFLKTMVEKYKPLLKSAVACALDVGVDLQNQYAVSEYVKAAAKSRKAKYDAYVAAGFTEEQAMSLLLTDIRSVATAVKTLQKNLEDHRSHD